MAKRPTLYVTEMRLRAAHDALAWADAEGAMTGEEAEAAIASYLDPRERERAIERRDEFGAYLAGMAALAEAKRQEGARLIEQANEIRAGLARMEAAAVRTMEALGVDELRGKVRVLKLKRTRGAVDVSDEGAIPKGYFRVKDDLDLQAIVKLTLIATDLYERAGASGTGTLEGSTLLLEEAQVICEKAHARRRSIDKKAIQEAWTNGREVAGVQKRVETTLEVK